ncbi:MAG TPA: cytochrome c maturation protein CcmE, partial [Gammaproteobacteria bacterium]
MKARHKRLAFVAIAIAGVAVAAALALSALQSNIAYFFSPTQVLAGEAPKDKVFRIGGMVT